MFQKIQNWFAPNTIEIKEKSPDEIKRIYKILFIDDQTFKVVNILQKEGWINTKKLKDIDSLNNIDVREAHIIFVDIQGVGKQLGFKDEGLGLIKALKATYPSKIVVVYSSERNGDRFHDGFAMADKALPKDADPYQFTSIVEKYSNETFSVNYCVEKLYKILTDDFGINISQDSVRKNLAQLQNKKSIDVATIAKVFSVSTSVAGGIFHIIKIFYNQN